MVPGIHTPGANDQPIKTQIIMKPNKYIYLKVIQGNYGYGWDDLTQYDTSDIEQMRECKADLRAYRENEREFLHRVIRRREPNPKYKSN